MKIGTQLFKGDANDSNTYLLAISDDNAVYVYRNFKGDPECRDCVASGWGLERVVNFPSLVIDGGQNWKVYPTKEAWTEIQTLAKTKH